MNLHSIPAEYEDEILKMNWIRDLATAEYNIVGPLAEWLQDGDRGYEDIPPGIRNEIFYKDLHSGETHACSIWKSFGYGIAEMESSKWQSLVHPDDRKRVADTFHDYVYRENVRVGQSMFRVVDTTGEYRWLLSSSASIGRNDNGDIYRYVGRDVDIGNRLEKELFLTRRIHEIEDRSAREGALMEAAGAIAGSTDDGALLSAINRAAEGLFALNTVRIIISDRPGEFRVAMGPQPPQGFDWELLNHIDPVGGTELPGNLYSWHLGKVAEGQALVLFARGRSPGPEADRLMGILGPIILGAWERVRHLDTLRRHATTDPLTGAWNRRAFMQQAGRSLRRGCENNTSGIVAIMDIDHFKSVNDKYGHPFGDSILVDVALAMNNALRPDDFMCRWGGEEFSFFLEGVSRTDAPGIVERIRTAAASAGADMELKVTLSAGYYAIDPDCHESLETALKMADEALLQAKAQGRNRTVEYGTD